MKEPDHNIFYDPYKARANAILSPDLVILVWRARAGIRMRLERAEQMGLDPESIHGKELIEDFLLLTRSESGKGAMQVTQAMIGRQEQQQEGVGQAPNLTPRQPTNPQAVAVVAYKGAKDLQRDIRRKRWGL